MSWLSDDLVFWEPTYAQHQDMTIDACLHSVFEPLPTTVYLPDEVTFASASDCIDDPDTRARDAFLDEDAENPDLLR